MVEKFYQSACCDMFVNPTVQKILKKSKAFIMWNIWVKTNNINSAENCPFLKLTNSLIFRKKWFVPFIYDFTFGRRDCKWKSKKEEIFLV